jgi:hypothetical protein
MNPEPAMHEITLSLDERNLAHMLTALALVGIAESLDHTSSSSRCRWEDGRFLLRSPISAISLREKAHSSVLQLRWVGGIGIKKDKGQTKIARDKHHGLFACGLHCGVNPLQSLVESSKKDTTPFKTFASHSTPGAGDEPVSDKHILENQQNALTCTESNLGAWLFQRRLGVTSWGFDCRVGTHAYDLGFSSNEDQSGHLDPIYPAIELLGLFGAMFTSACHSWIESDDAITYSAWATPVSLSLAPLAASGLIDGIESRSYRAATRGNSYGKGASFTHFPEATLISQSTNH